MAGRILPVGIYILHVSVETAEFSEKLGFVQKATRSFDVRFDAGMLVKPLVSVLFGAVDREAELVIIL